MGRGYSPAGKGGTCTVMAAETVRSLEEIADALGIDATPAFAKDLAAFQSWRDFPKETDGGWDRDEVLAFIERNKTKIASRFPSVDVHGLSRRRCGVPSSHAMVAAASRAVLILASCTGTTSSTGRRVARQALVT